MTDRLVVISFKATIQHCNQYNDTPRDDRPPEWLLLGCRAMAVLLAPPLEAPLAVGGAGFSMSCSSLLWDSHILLMNTLLFDTRIIKCLYSL